MLRLIILMLVLIAFNSFAESEEKEEMSDQDIISILGNEDPGEEEELKENINTQDKAQVDQALSKEIQSLNEQQKIDKNDNQANFKNFAQIRILNKITTKSEEIKISKDKINSSGKLLITMPYCWQSPSNLETENKAFLEIFEQMDNNQQVKIFSGWLFSSSPSISAVQHPIYDIHLLRCLEK